MAELTNKDAEAVSRWLDLNKFKHVSSTGEDSAAFGDRQELWERDGTLIRLTRDRGQWFYDVSRREAESWLDVDSVASAMGFKQTAPIERIEVVASAIDDRVFGALSSAVRHAP